MVIGLVCLGRGSGGKVEKKKGCYVKILLKKKRKRKEVYGGVVQKKKFTCQIRQTTSSAQVYDSTKKLNQKP